MSAEALARHNLGIAEDGARHLALTPGGSARELTTLGYIRASISALNSGQVPSAVIWLDMAHDFTTSALIRGDLLRARGALIDIWEV